MYVFLGIVGAYNGGSRKIEESKNFVSNMLKDVHNAAPRKMRGHITERLSRQAGLLIEKVVFYSLWLCHIQIFLGEPTA